VAPEHSIASDTEVGINENHQDNICLSDLQVGNGHSIPSEPKPHDAREDLEAEGGPTEANQKKLYLEQYMIFLHYFGLASFQKYWKDGPSACCVIQKVNKL